MSLINEMLRDLEAKRPDDLARQNLQREIRSLAPARQPRRMLPLLLIALLTAAGAGAYWLHAQGGLPIAAEAEVVPAVVVVPPPVVMPAHDQVSADKLRLAFELSVPPLPPEAPIGELPPVASTGGATVVAPAKTEAVQAVSGPVKIEKSAVLATPRDRAEAEYRKGEAALAAGHVGEAGEAMQAALRHDPAFIAPRQALLSQLLAQRRLGEAARLLEEGLALQPGQTAWAMSLARVQLELGELARADETLGRFQSQAMHLPEYAGFQGHLKSRLGAHGEAVAHYSRAVRMAPGEGRWWLGLGMALQADGKPADAKEAFRRALATSTLSAELANVAQQQIQN